MKPVSFEYHRPETVTEAVTLLDELDDAKVLAGGQSLVPLMNFRLAAPANLIDISRLEELAAVEVTPDAVLVGAAVTHSQLHDHAAAAEAVPLLREAESLIAHEVIRNRGTICGSLAHADPSGELTAVLMLLGGSVRAVCVDGARTIAGADLFEGPLQSSLAENELIVEATFPRPLPSTTTAFREVTRRHGDYAVCGVALAVDRDRGHTVTDTDSGAPASGARAVFISVGPTPRAVDLSPVVAGRARYEVDKNEIYDFVAARVDPASDVHGTADYRRHIAGILACRALEAAL